MKFKYLTALMSIGLLCSAMPVHAGEDVRTDRIHHLQYVIQEDHVEITGVQQSFTPVELVIPETIENLPVTEIRRSAFIHRATLESITFPDTLESIGNDAFYYTGLNRIDIPKNLISIGKDAFKGVYPEVITVDEENPAFTEYENILYDKDMTEFILIPRCITEVHIPDTMTEIPKEAFYKCEELTSVTLPEGLLTIGESAFQYTGISEITIPSTVRELKYAAFGFCPNLTSVTFAEGMKYIPTDILEIETIYCGYDEENDRMTGWSEFSYEPCGSFVRSYALRKIYLPGTLEAVEESVFGANQNYRHQFDVFYNGTRADWENIYIDDRASATVDSGGNEALLTGNIHCLPGSDAVIDGDVNLDETVSVSDFVALRKYLLKQTALSEYEYARADLNHDGIVNIYDLCILQQNLIEER